MSGQRLTVACPAGHAQLLELPTTLGLQVPTDPRLGLLTGTPGGFFCPLCQSAYQVELTGTYLDPARRHFILIQKPSQLPNWKSLEAELEQRFLDAVPPAQRTSTSRPWLKRLVFGLPGLKEKLALWETGLDDRLLEVIRLQAVQSAAGISKPSARELPALTAIDIEHSRLSFGWLEPGPLKGKVLHLPLPQYDALESRRELLLKQVPALFVSPFVDARRLLL